MFNLLTYESISLRYISSVLNRRETYKTRIKVRREDIATLKHV